MKKFSRYLNRLLYTAVIPASMLTALTAEATYQYGDFYYENVHAMTYDLEMVNPKGILYSGHIKIPSTANGHKVTSIGDNMFKGCEDLTEITLTSPTFIKNIGKDAFDGCSALTTVNIPNLDDWYKIYISPSTDASSPLFWAKLPSVDGVKIDSDITIKNSVEEISAGNFMASGVTSLTVKEFKSGNISYSIHLGTGAFKNAKDLKTVNIERSSSRIDEEAFYGCSSLENVSITYLEDYYNQFSRSVFENCTSLKSVSNKGIRTFRKKCFKNCTSLTEINLNGLKYIEDEAFAGCTSLSSIIIPESAASISPSAFDGCTGIKTFTVLSENIKNWEFLQKLPSDATLYVPYSKLEEVKGIWKGEVQISDLSVTDILPGILSTTFTINIGNNVNVKKVSVNKVLNEEITKNPSGIHTVETEPGIENTVTVLYTDATGKERTSENRFTTPAANIYASEYANVGDLGVTFAKIYVKANTDATTGKANLSIKLLNGTEKQAENGKTTDFTGLLPNKEYKYYVWLWYENAPERKFYLNSKFKTRCAGNTMTVCEISPTTAKVIITPAEISTPIKKRYLQFLGKTMEYSGEILLTGLIPGKSYGLGMTTVYIEGGNTSTQEDWVSINTEKLILNTEPAKAISNDCAIITAETNLSPLETATGFEWRRYDAPDEMPSSKAPCPVAEGHLTGRLHGLSAGTYYKYRPYLKDSQDNYHYGEWTAFITADAYVYFEPTVYTYEAFLISADGATLKGLAIAGSDLFTTQGFQYWKKFETKTVDAPEGAITVNAAAEGEIMTASITGLTPGTTYIYRAFAGTEKGMSYGEEMEFTTASASGIESINDGETDHLSFAYTIEGNNLHLRITGNGEDAVCRIYDITGKNIVNEITAADGTWHRISGGLSKGIYILHINSVTGYRTQKFIIR